MHPHNLKCSRVLFLLLFLTHIVCVCHLSDVRHYYYYYSCNLPFEFPHRRLLMVSPWRLTDNKTPQVFMTLPSILADLNNAVVWTVSTCPVISKNSSPCTNPLMTVQNAPITIGTIVPLFTFFQFPSVLSQDNKVYNSASSSFFIIIRSDRLAEIWWSVFIPKSQRTLSVSFSWRYSWLCINHLFVWSNINLLHNSLWITLPTQSGLVSYSFCDSLLHSLILWWIVLFLSLNNLHLLFCCILSILAFIWLVLKALFCPAIRRDSVSLLRFRLLSYAHVFSCEMSIVIR